MDTLYKRTKQGAIQYWKISVEDGENFPLIVKESGQLGTTNPTIHREAVMEGKNLGKANETTPLEQATSQAQSDWRKKHDDGYKSLSDLGITDTNSSGEPHRYGTSSSPIYDSLEAILQATLPQFNTDASGNVKPMLATDWKKIKKIDYPVLLQPKLDGVRCLMISSPDGIKFLSRSGKEYTTLGHIADDIINYRSQNISDANFILDGEIYSDELTFQEITQAVKKQYPNSLKLHFRAYDVVHEDSQEDRVVSHLANLIKAIKSPFLHMVPTVWVEDEEQVKEFHDKWVSDGYEGAMIRIPSGKYEQGSRSRTLLKVKEFDESEFKFVRWEQGQREEDLIAVCDHNGATFRAKMVGSREEKAKLDGFNVSKITVKHFGWTDDKLPRFPIGKAIRDYE